MTVSDDLTAPSVAEVEKAAEDRTALMALMRAIDAVILTNDALGFRLGEGRPAWTEPVSVGFIAYGANETFDLWHTWRAIERLRAATDAWTVRRQAASAAVMLSVPEVRGEATGGAG
jgi:hypothetical protein